MAATYDYRPVARHGGTARGRWLGALLDRLPRLVRFAAVGGTCALLQLLGLHLLVQARIEPHLANALAFLLSTQANFLLSSLITWRDRRTTAGQAPPIARRLAAYNALALGSLAINQAAFAVAIARVHYLAAATLGILAGMLLTYTISGHLIFRRPPQG